MYAIKSFIVGSLGTLGLLEVTDVQLTTSGNEDLQTLGFRFVLSLLAGVLTAFISKKMKIKKKTHQNKTGLKNKGKFFKSVIQFIIRKNKNHGKI